MLHNLKDQEKTHDSKTLLVVSIVIRVRSIVIGTDCNSMRNILLLYCAIVSNALCLHTVNI